MRRVREISAEEENFRIKPAVLGREGFLLIKRDPVEPEPIGTIIIMQFRITGYDPDCDGSLMARLECLDFNGEPTGWETGKHGLYPDCSAVVAPGEIQAILAEMEEK